MASSQHHNPLPSSRMANATIRILPAEEIAAQRSQTAPYIVWPHANSLFAEREMRLRQLAGGHALVDFLRFVASIAEGQRLALPLITNESLNTPTGADLAASIANGAPVLLPASWGLPSIWFEVFQAIVTHVIQRAPPATAGKLQPLLTLTRSAADDIANDVLRSRVRPDQMATAPLFAAALQVVWVVAAARSEAKLVETNTTLTSSDDLGGCPCCGSSPTASVIRATGDYAGQRYLVCSLCGTQWHRQRIECTHCGSQEHIEYKSLAASDGDEAAIASAAVVQAETCGACHHYLKVLHGDRDPMAEAVADDLATLTLDVLVGEEGFNRHGENLMLWLPREDGDSAQRPGVT
jgi:FdhE protein